MSVSLRVKLCQALGLQSTESLPTIQAAISAIADPTRRAFLQNILSQLVAVEVQPLSGWRNT